MSSSKIRRNGVKRPEVRPSAQEGDDPRMAEEPVAYLPGQSSQIAVPIACGRADVLFAIGRVEHLANPEAAQAMGFNVLLPLSFVSNAFAPTQGMPGWPQAVADWNPLSPVAPSCRDLFGNPNPGCHHRSLAHAAPRTGHHPLVGPPVRCSHPSPSGSTGAKPWRDAAMLFG
jgi:hypothetical protein